jgi:hypothetical protein
MRCTIGGPDCKQKCACCALHATPTTHHATADLICGPCARTGRMMMMSGRSDGVTYARSAWWLCTVVAHRYSASLLNISAMSYGSLSENAILALNKGARIGNFYHNTGEGGISRFHLQPGGDIVWNVGTGYFGCRCGKVTRPCSHAAACLHAPIMPPPPPAPPPQLLASRHCRRAGCVSSYGSTAVDTVQPCAANVSRASELTVRWCRCRCWCNLGCTPPKKMGLPSTREGQFCPDMFADTVSQEQIRMVEIKLSQGAKPGHGGILPKSKLTDFIREARGLPADWNECVHRSSSSSSSVVHLSGCPLGESSRVCRIADDPRGAGCTSNVCACVPCRDVNSPPSHSAFTKARSLMEFVARLRELSGGKPVGFKMCVGR